MNQESLRPIVLARFRGSFPRTPMLVIVAVFSTIIFSSHLSAAVSAQSENPSRLLTLSGRVDISRNNGANWAAGRTNMVLNVGNRVRTGRRSRATIQMTDKSVLRVRQLSTLVIQAPRSTEEKPVLDLQSGSSYFFSRESPTEVKFRTPLTSGAIRGTEFELSVSEDGQTEVTMLDGEVNLSNQFGEETIVSGEKGIVAPGEKPRKTPIINALNAIQWTLYYPGILNVKDLALTADDRRILQASLSAYERGDLAMALEQLPEEVDYTSFSGSFFAAITELSAGNIEPAEGLLLARTSSDRDLELVNTLQVFLSAIGSRPPSSAPASLPSSSSHWLAHSYLKQAAHDLEAARDAIKASLEQAPSFGFAWVRLAELEFGAGKTQAAEDALSKAQSLSPKKRPTICPQRFCRPG